MMLPDIIEVTPLEGHRLQLRFDDGVEGVVDVRLIIRFRGVFEPLRDVEYFRSVRVSTDVGTVVWPNGADLDPLVLYAKVTGVDVARLLSTEDAPIG